MPTPPNTADAFLAVVQRSGLIEAEVLRQHVMGLRQLPSPPKSLVEFARTLVTAGLLTEFHVKNMLKGRYKGFVVGKFKVMRPIGSGGMGTVYLCRHSTMGHNVAMKILPAKSTNDQVSVERFFREARAAAGLNHPNLVRAHDIDKQDNFYYLVMDYVEGVSLQDLVAKHGPLAPLRAAHYMAQASQGLQYIHNAGLAHRDIKPGNLIVDREGTVRILDLGLARYLDDRADKLTKQLDDHGILGTADYISPEQAVESHSVDNRTDLYSLGATFYFILAGRAPFEGASAVQKLMYHQTHEPVRLESIAPDVPPALADIVRRMMAKNPDDRFQHPEDIARALEPFTREPIDPPTDEEIPTVDAFDNGPNTGNSNGSTSGNTGGSNIGASSAQGARSRPRTKSGSASYGSGRNNNSFREKPSSRFGLYAALGGLAAAAGVAALFIFGPLGSARDTGSSGDTGNGARPRDPRRDAAANVGNRDKSPLETAKPLTAARIFLAATGAPEKEFTSFQDAVSAAKAGDRIVVRGEKLSQPVAFPPNFAAAVQGEGAVPGDKVLWELNPPAGQAGLSFTDSSAALKGFRFDGRGAITDAIQVKGSCAGFGIQDCEVVGFRGAGIHFADVAGSSEKPVTLRHVRIEAGGGAGPPAEVGLLYTGAANRFVQVTECRFEGLLAGVKIQSEIGRDSWVRNRFYQLNDGFVFAGASRTAAIDGVIENNAFFEISRSAFRFDGIPEYKSGELAVRYNLFANPTLRTKASIGSIEGLGTQQTPNVDWIWTKEDLVPNKGAAPGKYYFRKTFKVDTVPARALLDIGATDAFTVWLNGEILGRSEARYNPKRIFAFDATGKLQAGSNVIAVEVAHEADAVSRGAWTSPALFVQLADPVAKKVFAVSDAGWKGATEPAENWTKLGFDDSKFNRGVHIWPRNGGLPWDNAVLESFLEGKERGLSHPAWLKAEYNLRDYYWTEGAPLFSTMRGSAATNTFSLSQSPADDAIFLRYPTHNALYNLDFMPEGVRIGYPQD